MLIVSLRRKCRRFILYDAIILFHRLWTSLHDVLDKPQSGREAVSLAFVPVFLGLKSSVIQSSEGLSPDGIEDQPGLLSTCIKISQKKKKVWNFLHLASAIRQSCPSESVST